ncbi:MAG: ABC transporter permease [Firmicutes bacterium]|jgi:NitT/TauT family transport system permease protein|nr:ABC transporter permease [Bacillota bacterium]
MRFVWRKTAFYLFLVLGWYLLAHSGLWPEYMLPAPEKVFQNLSAGLRSGRYLLAIIISIRRLLLGYLLSLAIGIPLGMLTGKCRWLDETVGSLVLGMQTLPSICWLPLSLLWFGLNERAILFVVVMGAVLSITMATNSGVKNVAPLYIRAGRNMGAKGMVLFLRIILPAALPSIVNGLKQGWSFAWRSLMAGELLFINLGLGYLLMMGRELNDMAQVIAVMFIVVMLGLFFDRLLFSRLEKAVRRRWGFDQPS